MIYYLLVPLAAHLSALNVFRYITFRSIAALLTALVLSIVFGPRFIRALTRLKFGQYIHEDVEAHRRKAGTPTMGGLLIGFCIVTSVLLWGDLANEYVWMTVFVYFGFGVLGYIDDHAKVVKKQNKGLSAKGKLLGQIVVSGLAAAVLLSDPEYSTRLAVPFFKHINPDLGMWYLPFAMVVMIGASNAVNLTDGLDGLAIGPMIVNAAMFALFIYVAGHAQMARYLQVAPVSGVGEVTVFCGAMVGAGLGFLWFNAYPAQVFMGDVGSLSLGGALGFIAVLCKQEFLQVGYFKMTGGKRIFRMAPLHHHFELMGVPESKIIIRFWILSILLALVGLSTLKLR